MVHQQEYVQLKENFYEVPKVIGIFFVILFGYFEDRFGELWEDVFKE
jgi:hypothetical protein